MPVKDDQHFASLEELLLVKSTIVDSYIKRIEKDLNTILNIEYLSFAKGEEKVLLEIMSKNAECKICLWHTFIENRKVFEIALRLQPKDKETGYSGFNIKGEIKAGVVYDKGITHLYNQSGYPKW